MAGDLPEGQQSKSVQDLINEAEERGWHRGFDHARRYPAEGRPAGSRAATPVVDDHGNFLWLHTSCGMTQWLPAEAEPSYCGACCMRTQAWVQMRAESLAAPAESVAVESKEENR